MNRPRPTPQPGSGLLSFWSRAWIPVTRVARRRHAFRSSVVELAAASPQSGALVASIEQLGHMSVSARIGAIYALAHLACGEDRLLEVVDRILSAHVRLVFDELNEELQRADSIPANGPELDRDAPRQAIQHGSRVKSALEEATAGLRALSTIAQKSSFDGFRLDGVRWPPAAWGPDMHAIKVNAPGADLSGVTLGGADLTSADFSNAQWSHGDLNDVVLVDADLSHADLSHADLSNADLRGIDLTGANLTQADLTGANLAGAYLAHADLTAADLTTVRCEGADLTGADLRRTDLTEAELSRADLTESVLDEDTFNRHRVELAQWELTDGALRRIRDPNQGR